METKRRKEMGLVKRYIKNRIKEIEINMEVRNVKEPAHVHSESFERKMRRRLRRESEPRKKRRVEVPCMQTGLSDLSSEEILSSAAEKSEASTEGTEGTEEPSQCPQEKKQIALLQKAEEKASSIPAKKMKCGCISHRAGKASAASANASLIRTKRRKSIN